jgi:hypothetical protein
MQRKINYFGLAGGIVTIVLVAVSVFVPWWVLSVGQGLVKANVSPIYTDFNIVGNAFTVPLLLAVNVASVLFMTAGGVAILLYSVSPSKSYAKRLLGFAYSKPLFSLVVFVVLLVALQQILRMTVNLNVPLFGSATSVLPQSITSGTTVTLLMQAEFQWPFYLAIASAGLCLAARFYHKKIVSPSLATAVSAPPTPGTSNGESKPI